MKCNFRAFAMLNRFVFFFASLVAVCLGSLSWAADPDREQPTEVTADALHYDDKKRLSVFTGHVVLTRGSLKITGERLELQENEVGDQTGTATGQLAYFERTRAQAPNELIQGQAQRIVYDSKSNTLKLRGQGQLRRMRDGKLSDEVRGEAIDYFDDTGVFTAQGQASTQGKPGRVHIIIGPKPPAQGQ